MKGQPTRKAQGGTLTRLQKASSQAYLTVVETIAEIETLKKKKSLTYCLLYYILYHIV
jgi:hypothetical protein